MKNALDVGKAAEHLVCAELLLLGYRAFLSDQGLPYDVLVDFEGSFIKVQVKSSLSSKNINSCGKAPRIGYSFCARRRGKNGNGERLSPDDCDIIAFVALDIRAIAYLPIFDVGTTCQFMVPGYEFAGRFVRKKTSSIDQFPISRAIDRMKAGADKAVSSDAHLLEINGKKETLTTWSERHGASVATISQRLSRGWNASDAVMRKPSRLALYKNGVRIDGV